MKYLLIILTIILSNSCFGQYPTFHILPPQQIVHYTDPPIGKPIPIDSFNKNVSPLFYISNDSTYFVYLDSNKAYHIQFDSVKFYWGKKVYWENLMNAELEKINRLQNPQMTRKIFRYQDSCNRYQELLSRLKK